MACRRGRISIALLSRSLKVAGLGAPEVSQLAKGPLGGLSWQGVKGFASSADENDVVVVGGGPGGYVAAIKAAQLGLKTTCIEKRGTLGGTCLNVGCIPSKALLQSSHLYHEALHSFKSHGIIVSDVKVDLPAMMKQKDGAVAGLTKGIEGLFKKNKVTYVKGHGKLTGPNEVTVDLLEGGQKTVGGKNIIIATGSYARSLPGVTIDEKKIVSSTGALSLEKVPEKLVVIGGGVIGLEMGSVWNRLGSQVTVVEFLDGIGGPMDLECRKTFQRVLEKQKMKFMLKTKVVSVDASGDGVKVVVEPAAGGEQKTLECDIVLVSTGRAPYTEGLGFEEVGVQMEKGGRIAVDGHFKTSVPSIFAIGDAIHGPMLAHKAEEDGIACVENLAGLAGHVNYATVPGIIYTHPEYATVGLTEEEAKSQGLDYKVGKFPFMANSRARTIDDADGLVKFVADKATDKILGVHILGPSAGELIQECVMAMEYGASSEDIARTCHGHPTLSEAVKEAALATCAKAIHM
eukprot:TRINITY_DN23580_c0_g1_i1.p1 TRINITY_DN23580_c0_g1~~TRINITY_DN23580_c0_g1_i1.p1  ORF type:complete len:517 (+),score=93.38 TRINITY_DN23580_c0_g1_i1:142-1692(+)